jgi:hypothetical protein
MQSVLAPSPELGPLPEDDDEDNDFIVDLDEILAAAMQDEAAEQEQANSIALINDGHQILHHIASFKLQVGSVEHRAALCQFVCSRAGHASVGHADVDVVRLEQMRQTRLRSQHDQQAAQQQLSGPVTHSQLAQLHLQISQHTQLLMQVLQSCCARLLCVLTAAACCMYPIDC